MRNYGTVTPGIWTGETGRLLRGDTSAQLLAVYLMTNPHANMIGLYYCPISYIVADTGLSHEGASKGLARLSEVGFVVIDTHSEWVWVREMARYQIADELKPKDHRVNGIINELARTPNIGIKRDFIEKYRDAFCLGKHFQPSPFEGASKPLPSQDQEQEQNKKIHSSDEECGNAAASPPSTVRVIAIDRTPYDELVSLYHEILPELRRCKILTKARRGYLRQRWHDKPGPSLDAWRRYFEHVRTCPFLMGQIAGRDGMPPFEADMEWLIRPANIAKILEGKFDPIAVAAHG